MGFECRTETSVIFSAQLLAGFFYSIRQLGVWGSYNKQYETVIPGSSKN